MSEFTFLDVLNSKDKDTLLETIIRIQIHELIENKENNYSLGNIEELASSIETLGLLQPLLVKENDNNTYTIIAGHRRYNAIKKLIDENRLDKNYYILVKKVLDDENDIVTRLKLHETNLQTRSLLKLSDAEKHAIVEDYMNLIKQAKEKGIKINGKEVKGKTRDIIAERFNISHYTAQKIIRNVKEKEGGANFSPPVKTPKNKGLVLKKVLKNVKTIEQGLDEEETKIAQEIIEVIEQLI